MTDSVADTDDAIGVIREFGCPICGEAAESITPRSVSSFDLRPCGHLVFRDDAGQMKEFYRKLWFARLHQ